MHSLAYAQGQYIDVFTAILIGDLDQVKEFLDTGADVDTINLVGETLLFHSIFFERTEITMTLLEAGADINKRDILGRTALYWAIIKRNQKVAKILIEREADLEPNSDASQVFSSINLGDIVPVECISDSPQTWIDAETHSEFLPYIERYLFTKKEITGQEGFDYPVKILFYRSDSEVWRQFSRLAEKFTLQGTTYYIPSSKHILINYDAWFTRPENVKEMLIFHELGHFDLDRNHEPKEAKSIMSVFYLQESFLQGIDINEDSTLRQEL